jgi:predicted NBD/HSP70 family sugar kinase
MTKKEEIKQYFLKELRNHGALTRIAFINATGYRAASVFEAIDELKAEGIITEPDRKGQKTGRKSPPLTFKKDYAYFVGLELATDNIYGTVIDNTGEPLFDTQVPLPQAINLEKVISCIQQILSRLQTQCGCQWAKVKGIGFADPGLVDIENKISLRAVNVPGWENINTGDLLQKLSGIKNTTVLPETVARTFAEYHARLPHPPKSIFQLNIGSGIGGGFIKEGELFIGDTCRAMEIGHIVIVPDGPICQCGNRGCLEAVAGEAGIKRKIEELKANRVDTELDLDNFSLESFIKAAKRDRAAMMIASEISESVSLALATTVSLLNPSMVVIGGELAGLGDMLINAIRRKLSLHCFPGVVSHLKIEISKLNSFAAAHAAALIQRNILLEGNK